MFYAPTIPATLAPLSRTEVEGFADVYSDFHKDAIGCRPASCAPADPLEAAKEQARLEQWMAEDSRIEKLAYEVARFRLSKSIAYIMRSQHFGGPSEKRAFQIHCEQRAKKSWSEIKEELSFYGWDSLCYDLELPYSDAEALKAWYEGLSFGSAELFVYQA